MEAIQNMNNLVFENFEGCGTCILCKEVPNCKKIHVPVEITFTKPQKADNWGRLVIVFDKGEKINGMAVIKDNKVYCASAKSNICEEYEDFIELKNVEIKML